MFLSFVDLNIGYVIPDSSHIKLDIRYKYSIDDGCEYIRPIFSQELTDWLEENDIEYELRCIKNWFFKDTMKEIYSQIGIVFFKPSDAVLFKLKWM